MIEQEKAVQFRFDISEKSLSERLAELGLPPYARLFSCVGLPNVFAWRNLERAESFQETWLYIPDTTLEGVISSQRSFGVSDKGRSAGNGSFLLDKQKLYPINSGGKCNCIVAIPEDKEFDSSDMDLARLDKIEKNATLVDKSDTVQIAYEFVSRLFDCKQSYAEYAHKLLTFLTDQVDKSYAGLYWKGSESFHRRWAYGDLQLSDKLPLTVHSDMVDKWRSANSRGKTFVPAELILDEPVFVQVPPSFLFVYRTPNFADREQWLVMAVPGDISGAAIARITIIAGILSSIDDDRTTGYSELMSMFGELLSNDRKSISLDEALKNCFRLIDGKLLLSSMCLLDNDMSLSSCMRETDDQLHVEHSQMGKMPDKCWKVIESMEPMFLEGPAHQSGSHTGDVGKVEASHVIFPIPLKGGHAAILSAEFTSKLDRARHYKKLFELAAKYLGICISLTRSSTVESHIVGTPSGEIAESMALARLKTVGKLNGGYFHEITEFLSVILGQAEIMEHEIGKPGKSITGEDLLISTDRIVRAACSLASRLEQLKDVSTIRTIDGGSVVAADQFLEFLPGLTYGYILTVKDYKNVEINVQTKTDRNVGFSIPSLHVFDYILPLILGIMDEAICSGKIVVSLAEDFGRPALRIAFAKKLLGKTSLEKLVPKVFIYHRVESGADGALIISAGNAHFAFSDCDGDRYQAIYTLASNNHPIEEFN